MMQQNSDLNGYWGRKLPLPSYLFRSGLEIAYLEVCTIFDELILDEDDFGLNGVKVCYHAYKGVVSGVEVDGISPFFDHF